MLVLVHLARDVPDVGLDGAAGELHADALEAELADGHVVVVCEPAIGDGHRLFRVLAAGWARDGEDVGEAHVPG